MATARFVAVRASPVSASDLNDDKEREKEEDKTTRHPLQLLPASPILLRPIPLSPSSSSTRRVISTATAWDNLRHRPSRTVLSLPPPPPSCLIPFDKLPLTPSPPTSSIMLDRLPTELLLRTLDLAAPLDYSPSFCLERRQFLRSCCLVSKKLCAIAQPMLPEVYEVSGLEDLEVLQAVEGSAKRGSKVKVVVFEHSEDTASHTAFVTLTQLVTLLPALVDVRLHGVGTVDLSALARLSALRHLIIFGVDISDFSDPEAAFANLLELSIANSVVDDKVLNTFPSARQTPALKAFGFSGLPGAETLWMRETWPTLDILELNTDVPQEDGTPQLPNSTLCIFEQNIDFSTLPSSLPSAFRIYAVDDLHRGASASNTAATLEVLISQLDDLPPLPSDTSLRYLSLPSPIRHSPALLPLVDGITRLCDEKGVELYWDPAPDWTCESTVSPALWKRARELRRERERRGRGSKYDDGEPGGSGDGGVGQQRRTKE